MGCSERTLIFNWSKSLEQKLSSSPILAFPNMKKPIFWSVDAPESAIGLIRPDFFYSLINREKFRFRVGEQKNIKKSSENDQLTGHFQSFFYFFIFRAFFFNVCRKKQ